MVARPPQAAKPSGAEIRAATRSSPPGPRTMSRPFEEGDGAAQAGHGWPERTERRAVLGPHGGKAIGQVGDERVGGWVDQRQSLTLGHGLLQVAVALRRELVALLVQLENQWCGRPGVAGLGTEDGDDRAGIGAGQRKTDRVAELEHLEQWRHAGGRRTASRVAVIFTVLRSA